MIKRAALFFLILFLFPSFTTATLGISPAIVNLDFKPGAEYEFSYTIISDNPDVELQIYANGDLSKYVTLSKEKTKGAGTFTAKIKFPDEIDKPGLHRIGIGVKETPPEDQFLGTAIDISGAIKVFVPYPGKYLEAELSIPDGNINEQIPVQLHVINRGKEDIDVNANIKFFSDKKDLVHDMVFSDVFLRSTEDKYFRRYLNTTGFRAGNYLAAASINYGQTEINKTFRIGSLFVNITNFTEGLPKGGIQKFLVGIESKWNSDIDNVYADINISNSTESISIRTPGIELSGWNRGELAGFLDTTAMEGKYNTNIALNYAGEHSFSSGELVVLRQGLSVKYIVLGIIAVVVIAIIVMFIHRIKKRPLIAKRRR